MHDIKVNRYWSNRLTCWHGKEHRRLVISLNGITAFCSKCNRKHFAIHDFGAYAFIYNKSLEALDAGVLG